MRLYDVTRTSKGRRGSLTRVCVLISHSHLHAQLYVCAVWQDIQDDLVQCMENIRNSRIENERKQVLRTRWRYLEDTLTELSKSPEARDYNISVGDIALMPEIREILDSANEVVLDEALLEEVSAGFSDMIERWKRNVDNQLRELVVKSQPATASSEPESKAPKRKTRARAKAERKPDVLELATTRFHCNSCNQQSRALYYPGVLAHECLRDRQFAADDIFAKLLYEARGRFMEPILCNLDKLTVAQPSAAAEAVIRLCGKDPQVVTAQEMNELDVMLLQKGEKGGKGDNTIRTWRSAVRLLFVSRSMASS